MWGNKKPRYWAGIARNRPRPFSFILAHVTPKFMGMSDRLSINKKSCMRKAIQLSEKKMHENNGGPFGSVIVKDGQN